MISESTNEGHVYGTKTEEKEEYVKLEGEEWNVRNAFLEMI